MRPAVTTLLLTAVAPTIWGTTYIVTTELLPGYPPMMVAMLRALPAGLLLLLIVRQLPTGIWWLRSAILGALNWIGHWYKPDGALSPDQIADDFAIRLTADIAARSAKKQSKKKPSEAKAAKPVRKT